MSDYLPIYLILSFSYLFIKIVTLSWDEYTLLWTLLWPIMLPIKIFNLFFDWLAKEWS